MFSKKIAQIGNEVILITNKVMLRRVDGRARTRLPHTKGKGMKNYAQEGCESGKYFCWFSDGVCVCIYILSIHTYIIDVLVSFYIYIMKILNRLYKIECIIWKNIKGVSVLLSNRINTQVYMFKYNSSSRTHTPRPPPRCVFSIIYIFNIPKCKYFVYTFEPLCAPKTSSNWYYSLVRVMW